MIGQIVKTAGGALLGIGLNKLGQKGQLKQQQKLQDQQIKGAKEMSDYGMDKQKELWDKTNYGAQADHLRKAGLNVGLMYGMGGGAGGTTGTEGGGMPTTATAEAPSGGNRNIMDMALMKAQTAVMESQARKNNVEADKTEGVDTEEKSISNRKAELETKVRESLGLENLTKNEQIKMDAENVRGGREVREFTEWMEQAFTNENKEGTTVETDALGSYIRNNNDLIKEATKAGLQEKIQNINNMVKEWELKRSQEKLNEIEAEIRGFKSDLSNMGLNEQTTQILNTLLKAIFR